MTPFADTNLYIYIKIKHQLALLWAHTVRHMILFIWFFTCIPKINNNNSGQIVLRQPNVYVGHTLFFITYTTYHNTIMPHNTMPSLIMTANCFTGHAQRFCRVFSLVNSCQSRNHILVNTVFFRRLKKTRGYIVGISTTLLYYWTKKNLEVKIFEMYWQETKVHVQNEKADCNKAMCH